MRRLMWGSYLVINECDFISLQEADAFFYIHQAILMQLEFPSNTNSLKGEMK
jgi:hypothetical protein